MRSFWCRGINIFKLFYQFFIDRIVDISPRLFLNSLTKRHNDLLVRRSNKWSQFDYNDCDIPKNIEGFEDFSFLFWNSPLNRGILRQDFDEAASLYKHIKSLNNPCGIEIGRFSGGSTLLIASAVGKKGKLLSIDKSPQNDEKLRVILTHAELLERVELVVGDANELVRDEQYDFVFIDGDHSYEGAKKDHNKWGKLVRAGGYIIHHDMGNGREYSTQHGELSLLMNDIINKQQDVVELIEEVGSMCMFRRKSDSWIAI